MGTIPNMDPIALCNAEELSSYGYFQRKGVKEMLNFFNKTMIKRTEAGQRQSITHECHVVHCYVRSDGLAGSVVTDSEYPSRVAFVLLTQILEEFIVRVGVEWKTTSSSDSISFPVIEEYLTRYQNPGEADKVTKIQQDLVETTQ